MYSFKPADFRAGWGLCLAALLVGVGARDLAAATKGIKMPVAPKWGRFEHAFQSRAAYRNPFQDVALTVTFTSPLGETFRVPAFWDGGNTWRVRFSPDVPGQWTFQSVCSDPMNDGLHHRAGEFMCTSPLGQSRFDQHGVVRMHRSGTHLEHADYTPFFWLADTPWTGARIASQKDWETYAQLRLDQGYNCAIWAAAPGKDQKGDTAFTGFPERIGVNPDYFRRLDAKVAALANAGMLSGIVPFSETELTGAGVTALPDDQVQLLIQYMLARWGAEPVVWVLVVDNPLRQRPWKQMGQALFSNISHAPVMIYAGSDAALLREFAAEKWVGLFGLRPFTSFAEEALAAGFDRAKAMPKPVIAFTPVENAPGPGGQRFTAEQVRRAAWWSVVELGAVGLSYSGLGVYNWDTSLGPPWEAGSDLPIWHKSMFMPAAKQAARLGALMSSLPFFTLRSDPALLANQPGKTAPRKQVVAGRNADKDLLILYSPEERSVEVKVEALPTSPSVTWVNTQTGERTPAVAVVSGQAAQFPTPAAGDWVLVARKGK